MSHFSNIGFTVDSQKDFFELCQKVYEKCTKVKAGHGSYFRYADQSGSELWIQENDRGQLVGANPYFSGQSKRKVRLEKKGTRDGRELDGYFVCTAIVQDEKGDEVELYPFVFDVPDADSLPEIKLSKQSQIQLSAFAHEIKCYKDEKEFMEKSNLKMASKSFIPSGLFFPGGKPKTPPEAFGILIGEVKEAEIKTNTFSRQQFYWLLVETFGGEVDVVADINQFKTPPKKGNIISGQFWLTGRILDVLARIDQKSGFFKKIFS